MAKKGTQTHVVSLIDVREENPHKGNHLRVWIVPLTTEESVKVQEYLYKLQQAGMIQDYQVRAVGKERPIKGASELFDCFTDTCGLVLPSKK